VLAVNGQKVIDVSAGIYSEIRTQSSLIQATLFTDPSIKITNNIISIEGIIYGDKNLTINETWTL